MGNVYGNHDIMEETMKSNVFVSIPGFLCLFFLFLIGCDESRQRHLPGANATGFFSLDTAIIDSRKGIIVPDSIVREMYLNGRYQAIVDTNFCLDNQLKKGIYSAALSCLSRYEDAAKYLSCLDNVVIDQDLNIPVFTKKQIDFYTFYSLYKYFSLNGNPTPEECATMLSQGLNKAGLRDSVESHLYEMESLNVALVEPSAGGGMDDNRNRFGLVNRIDAYRINDPMYRLVAANMGYANDSNRLVFTKSIDSLIARNFQKEYNTRMLLSHILGEKDLDTALALKTYKEYKSNFPNECSAPGLEFEYNILLKYDTAYYNGCLKCILNGSPNNVVYGNVFLGYYYLRNKQFGKVDSLIALHNKKMEEQGIYGSPIRLWELGEYYGLELGMYFLQDEFDKFRELAFRMESNEKFRGDYKNNESEYQGLIKTFYKLYVDRDLSGFSEFIARRDI